MAELKFEVLHSEWVADGERFSANDNPHEVARSSAALRRLAGSAHHAGVIVVTAGLEDGHVQSQEDGELALAEAMGEHSVVDNPDGTRTSRWSGPWQESQDVQAALDAESDRLVEVDLEPVEPDEDDA